ncbi:uncharacterized protein [Musca autumnalis]|uniref:uncharacterized protein n=1 Tax=Musca autumnalis TaxID=221902 RepID=UPI003CF593D1
MAPAKTYTCPICSKTIGKVYSVGCSNCPSYFHPACIGMSEKEVKSKKDLVYECKKCSRKKAPSCSNASDTCSNSVTTNVDTSSGSSTVAPGGNDDIISIVTDVVNDMAAALKAKIEQRMQSYVADFRSTLDGVVARFREEFLDGLRKVTDDVKNCEDKIGSISTTIENINKEIGICKSSMSVISTLQKRIENMEIQNGILQRRLNRSNIIINGLPTGLHNISEFVARIAAICNVCINPIDLQHCCYFAGGKSILVKFNSVLLRDTIMANYRRGPPIKLNAVIGGNLQTHIYLDDHLTPASARLMYVCRMLRKQGKLEKFILVNGDEPGVNALFPNGNERFLKIDDCERLLASS